MYWQFNLYLIPLIIAAVISTTLMLYGWRRRETTPAAISFAVLMLAVAEWSLGYALELGSTDLATMTFWAKVEYLGIATIGPAWLAFALQFSNRDQLLTRRNLVLLTLIPSITLVVVWTNELHGWLWSHLELDPSGPFPALAVTYGPWFWVNWAFSYVCLLLGTILSIRMVLAFPRLYRLQASLMLLGVMAPWVSNGLYLAGLRPIPHLDLTPFAFTLTGLAAGWNLFRFRFLDVLPVARRAIVEGMQDGVIVLDAQHRIVDLNLAAQQIIGQPAAAVLGQPDSQILKEWPDWVEHYRDVLEANSEIVLGTGEAQRHFDLRISPLFGRGKRLNARLIVLRNVTEQRQAEAALRQSEQRFRHVVASISDHIYMTEVTSTGQHINLYLSPHAENLTGYPLAKFSEDWSFWPTVVIHPGDRAAAASQAARLASGQDSQLEYRLVRADGEIIWVRDSGRAERDNKRQSIFIYGVVSDITERKRAEAELAQAHDQALEASRLKTELLAKVSHELRTPLGAILGFSEMLDFGYGGSLSKEQKAMVAEIIDSTHYLTHLVNELLDQAQLDAGKLKLHLTSFAPTDVFNGALSKLEVLANNKGLDLATEIAPDLPPALTGDLVRLQQILVNLGSNAIKFTQRGQVRIRVYRFDTAHWAIQVADTGIGIPHEAQAHLFQPFTQVDGSITREHAGTGLGLSIVEQLATLMGGEVTLKSEVGRGSVFTILLPFQLIQEKIK